MVNYGIIGVGMMGREHLINLYHLKGEGVAVVAIADPHLPSQQQALNLAHSFNWPLQVFSGHNELLKSAMCDVLVVSTPNMTHCEILMDIINHPKPHHVLVEKPLCTTVADCKKVIDAVKSRPDVLIQVGLEYRYMPPVAKLIDVVKGGKLGQVKMVAIREHRFPFLVKVNNWNRFNCNTGGTLVEKCCHFFDLMRLFAGSNPVCIMASGGIDVNHKDETYDGKVLSSQLSHSEVACSTTPTSTRRLISGLEKKNISTCKKIQVILGSRLRGVMKIRGVSSDVEYQSSC